MILRPLYLVWISVAVQRTLFRNVAVIGAFLLSLNTFKYTVAMLTASAFTFLSVLCIF